MSTEPFTGRALVARTVAYGEADLVVHLLVRGRGRVGAFARGGRKSHKRFGGALEPFALVDVELADRRGGDLLELRGASIVTPHLEIRSDLGRLAHAGYALELARELTREHEPNDAIFDLATDLLSHLAATGARSLALRAFELAALGAAGFAPVLGACARCGADLPGEAAFDVGLGGTACPACKGPFATPIDAAAVRLLQALERSTLAQAAQAQEAGLPLDPVRQALRRFIDHHVPHELRSLGFMRDVGAPE